MRCKRWWTRHRRRRPISVMAARRMGNWCTVRRPTRACQTRAKRTASKVPTPTYVIISHDWRGNRGVSADALRRCGVPSSSSCGHTIGGKYGIIAIRSATSTSSTSRLHLDRHSLMVSLCVSPTNVRTRRHTGDQGRFVVLGKRDGPGECMLRTHKRGSK